MPTLLDSQSEFLYDTYAANKGRLLISTATEHTAAVRFEVGVRKRASLT